MDNADITFNDNKLNGNLSISLQMNGVPLAI